MGQPFDAYYKWLGIPEEDQPPNHYRLLGVQLYESDPDVIESAADQRMGHVRRYQSGRHADLSQQILNEVAAARVCLLNPSKRAAYDAQLQQAMRASPTGAQPHLDLGFPIIDEVPSPRMARQRAAIRAARRKRQSLPVGTIIGISIAVVSVVVVLAVWKIASNDATSSPNRPAAPSVSSPVRSDKQPRRR